MDNKKRMSELSEIEGIYSEVPWHELDDKFSAKWEIGTQSVQIFCRHGWVGPIQAVQTINQLQAEVDRLKKVEKLYNQIIEG